MKEVARWLVSLAFLALLASSVATSEPTAEECTAVLAKLNGTNTTNPGNGTSEPAEGHETQPWEKFTGFGLAVASSLAIGTSFILAKKGLIATKGHVEGSSYSYLKSPIWWAGQVCMILGEALNFAAYSFAPAILVTPLGALSVLIGAVLASYFLKEKLNFFAKIGCALCILGSIDVVLHAPPERDIPDVDTLVRIGTNPGFIIYLVLVVIFSVAMIWKVAPKYGRKNPLVYISICSSVGSISVMAVKGFGIALKLTFEGKSQLGKASTYIFLLIVIGAALTQINYFNKALAIFSTSVVTPIYYVMFTTLTIVASVLLLQGISGATPSDIVTALVGFFVIFLGVLLLHPPRYFVKDILIQPRESNASGADSAAAAAAAAHSQLHPEDFDSLDANIALEPIGDPELSYDSKYSRGAKGAYKGNGSSNGGAVGPSPPPSRGGAFQDDDMANRRLAHDGSEDDASEPFAGDDEEELGLVNKNRSGYLRM